MFTRHYANDSEKKDNLYLLWHKYTLPNRTFWSGQWSRDHAHVDSGPHQQKVSDHKTPEAVPVTFDLPEPLNGGKYYTCDETANLVITQTAYNTSERKLMMNAIVNRRKIPVKYTSFSNLISILDYPHMKPVIGENWGRDKGSKTFRVFFEGPREVLDFGWKGSICLRVSIINHWFLHHASSCRETEKVLSQKIVSILKEIYICVYLGQRYTTPMPRLHNRREGSLLWTTCRYYFDPDKFPLPPVGVRVASSTQCKAVISHIRLMAMARGSPDLWCATVVGMTVRYFDVQSATEIDQIKVNLLEKSRPVVIFTFTMKWDSNRYHIC